MTATKRLFIETVGCQMNVLDSELVVAALRRQGWEMADSAAEADAVFYNTCSVRQHAEDKIYSALGRVRQQKQQQPGLIVGVLGCMAQKDQELIRARAPWVDLVVASVNARQKNRIKLQKQKTANPKRKKQNLQQKATKRKTGEEKINDEQAR